jgi:[protein-PII] uridylyltransferase
MPIDESLAAYAASMPDTYRAAFDDDAIALHAAVVARRPSGRTHVETWKELSERVLAICIVADDRPGLLAQISTALVANEIDVVSAHAYCRERAGVVEAVDFLWIRRRPAPSGIASRVRREDVAAIAGLVDALLDGHTAFGEGTRLGRPTRLGSSTTTMKFDRDPHSNATVLTVKAVDRPGLLLSVTRTIFQAGIQIVGLHATTERGRAVDRFELVDADGSALVPERLLGLQTAILEAVEASVVRVTATTLDRPAP